ncbi:4767_t:CDS:2 [Acaulospora colombiana]|uniref:4767_t:CDS:1 n=1 Tax=Acaulospora colombiana TaxID=27376 RepID=A0ACA9LH37_9GLOM|nr:4767_t:CDS:2 [Acaulospora colombiana]
MSSQYTARLKVLQLPDEPFDENRLPLQIGSNVSVEHYNDFLNRCESSGYKFQLRDNGDVFIIDMAYREHEFIVSLLQDYFKIPNGGVILNPPIDVVGQPFHYCPSGNGEKIAPDIAVYPSMDYIPKPTLPYPGPPPSDINAKLWRQEVRGFRVWDFGTLQTGSQVASECNAPNLPAYQVNIPVSDVFWNPPIIAGVPVVAGYAEIVPNTINGNNFNIDLYQIQQLSLKVQDNN